LGTSRLAGRGRPSATSAGVEVALVWAFLGIRGFDLGQVAVALSVGGIAKSADPALSVGLLVAVAAESLLLGGWLVRRRSVLPFKWPVAVDIGLSLAVMALTPLYISSGGALVSVTMWAYSLNLSTLMLLAAALVRVTQVLAVSGAQAITYLAVVGLPLINDATGRATAVANALALPGLALVAFLVVGFVRDLASTADAARKRVAELEQERSRALIHDLLVYLRLDRFAQADDKTRAAMIAAALAKHEQMRSYVDGTRSPPSLQARIEAVLRLHPAIPVSSRVEVSPDIHVGAEILEQLEHSLDTALANAEQHAPGANVLVSARSAAGELSVTVRDDGPGFDMASTRAGFGISEILGRQLAGVGGTGVVESVPGSGTVVRITLPLEQS